MKHQKKMLKKFDIRQKDFEATIAGIRTEKRNAYKKPGSRKLKTR